MHIPSAQSLSLREKIGQTCQMHGKDLAGIASGDLPAFFHENPVGSVFLGGEVIAAEDNRAEALQQLIAASQCASRIPLSIAGDLENGAGGAIHGLTTFPHLLALGAVNDAEAAYEYGRWTAEEARRIGFNWTFGPVVDLSLNWLNPIVNIRSLGQFPGRVAELATALIRGCQENGLSATAKHFPGDGVDYRDQHLCVSVNSLGAIDWFNTFGEIYKQCFKVGVHSVMVGHIALPWLERTRGTGCAPLPATTSHPILTSLLRDQLGFDGVVVSDALIMAGFRGHSQRREDLIIEAFNAGVDVMLWPGAGYIDFMERAIESGRISEARLDQSVERILNMKARQGLFEEAPIKPLHPASSQPVEGAVVFATDLAERSLTLIENRRNLLPLDPKQTRKIQILLATSQEKGARERLAPLLQDLEARGITVDLHINGNCLDLRKKEAAGERWDALLAIFELWTHGIKNTMRPTGDMAECLWTIQGLETISPIVISLGSPYLLYDTPWAETYVNAYSSNPFTLRALDRALFGEIGFDGVPPVTLKALWPEVASCPSL